MRAFLAGWDIKEPGARATGWTLALGGTRPAGSRPHQGFGLRPNGGLAALRSGVGGGRQEREELFGGEADFLGSGGGVLGLGEQAAEAVEDLGGAGLVVGVLVSSYAIAQLAQIGFVAIHHGDVVVLRRQRHRHRRGPSAARRSGPRPLSASSSVSEKAASRSTTSTASTSPASPTFVPPDGGMSLWVRLPVGWGDDFTAVARTHGVSVLPGSSASAREDHLDHIRISCTQPHQVLTEGVARLERAWHAYRRTLEENPSTAV